MLAISEFRSAQTALLAALCLCGGIRPTVAADQPVGPLSPDEALATFQIAPGLRVELVVAEPLVVDPVDIAFDEDGRLWVVEMRDYPHGPAPGEPPMSRIRVLEDPDGDGRFERSRVFADELLFANGVLPWKGGVFVTVSGAILYLKDTDGDGRADQRETSYAGFAEQNPQLRVNQPTLGIDNWVYAANGLRGGSAVRADDPDAKPVALSGMDFRFDPLSRRYEAISGMGQFGLTFDDWGNRFVCSNRNHNRHMVLEDRYIKRNPYLAVPETAEDTPVHGAASEVFPLSRNWTTSTLHTGTFTAACGVTVYRGDLLGTEFAGNSFTCEPTGNLVHRDVLEPAGATFRARRGREGVEFLASPDEWFRPVNLANGPDGALYVVDMYRAVIEHPEFMPPELKERPDLRDGDDRGRIWRLVPAEDGRSTSASRDQSSLPERSRRSSPSPLTGEGRGGGDRRGGPPTRALPREGEGALNADAPNKRATAMPRNMRPLTGAPTAELVALLAHPNGWWRETAQRLLIERQNAKAVDALRFLLGSAHDPRARLHAAWTLDGLGTLDEHALLRLLDDEHPRVREHAVRLAERILANSPAHRKRVVELADDPDPRVRFQVALSLGELEEDDVLEPLAAIASRDSADRWTRLAVASSVPDRAGALFAAILSRETAPDGQRPLLQELCTLVGSRRDAGEVTQALTAIAHLGTNGDGSTSARGDNSLLTQIAALNGLAEGVRRRGGEFDVLLRMPSRDAADSLAADIRSVFHRAALLAADAEITLSDRVDAVHLLGNDSNESGSDVLARLIHASGEPPELRTAAVRALAGRKDPNVAVILLIDWRTYSPPVRNAVADALTRSPARIAALLDALEAGTVQPAELGLIAIQRLRGDRLPDELRRRAERLVARGLPEDRGKVLDKYRAALDLEAHFARGRAVFEKNCATCHRVAGIGVDVGPDIADSRTRTPEALLVDILNPNQAIDANYITYNVVTQAGQVLTGVIASETASSVTLRRAENETEVVLRQDIDEIRSNGVSLMPEGVEKDITVQEMADLIGFLKNWRYEGERVGE